MSQSKEILGVAHQRALDNALPYSGAVTPEEAARLMGELPNVVLVDVRSAAEWQFVGTVPGSVRIELKTWPGMQPNPHFLAQLKEQVSAEALVLFMCRSGVRSDEAARIATGAGYSEVYNVLEGFEGDKDAAGHRGTVGGWKGHGLPWVQS
ncbi:rhodanese-like domain-containing protein [Crenobacter cavernae]|uniref:Rhodanese-like domain-containing protein n=1 Tax=Crenobacter cavernae TaxID=2290923 RepID=A0A345Y6I2_9NEIS|nr:rhodanese-like domain-containing protein [Crenobacter cavernae]AXK39534.1 rhodanese-like domain-containing protein [Crenobacter cavernae]